MLTRPFPPGHFSQNAAPGHRRAIAVNVMIFFAFALTALVFLTKSAVAANAINRDVGAAVAPSTVGIETSTSHLSQLNKTVLLTSKIARGTESLSGHLDRVVTSTDRIDANLTAIGSDVTVIGETVDRINRTVSRIRPEIFTLGGTVDGIHSKAGDISSRLGQVAIDTANMTRSLAAINASLSSVLSITAPLNGSVSGITTTIGRIAGHTRSIADSPILLSAFPMPGVPLPDVLGALGLRNIVGGGQG